MEFAKITLLELMPMGKGFMVIAMPTNSNKMRIII